MPPEPTPQTGTPHLPKESVGDNHALSPPNPYQPTSNSSRLLGPPPVDQQSVEPERKPAGLRVWTTLAIPALSLALFLALSAIMVVISMWMVHGTVTAQMLRSQAALEEVSESRLGLFLLVVTPQLALLIPSCVAALLSPVEFRERLGLVRGHWPLWGWGAAAAATPLIGLISSLVVGQFVSESENLKAMSDVFRVHGQTGFFTSAGLHDRSDAGDL